MRQYAAGLDGCITGERATVPGKIQARAKLAGPGGFKNLVQRV
ncbi:MAG: hypothetical protein AAF418_03010 [Pseudomonadota bacterium]